MPDPIKNLIEMVKKGWETATDGIERPVRISGLPGRHIIVYHELVLCTLET